MAKIKITLKKSPIGYNKKQRATAEALGLKKLQSSVIQEDTPDIMGKIAAIAHLLKWEPFVEETPCETVKPAILAEAKNIAAEQEETQEEMQEVMQKEAQEEAQEETPKEAQEEAQETVQEEAPKRTPKKMASAVAKDVQKIASEDPPAEKSRPKADRDTKKDAEIVEKPAVADVPKRTTRKTAKKDADTETEAETVATEVEVKDALAKAPKKAAKRTAKKGPEAATPENQQDNKIEKQ